MRPGLPVKIRAQQQLDADGCGDRQCGSRQLSRNPKVTWPTISTTVTRIGAR